MVSVPVRSAGVGGDGGDRAVASPLPDAIVIHVARSSPSTQLAPFITDLRTRRLPRRSLRRGLIVGTASVRAGVARAPVSAWASVSASALVAGAGVAVGAGDVVGVGDAVGGATWSAWAMRFYAGRDAEGAGAGDGVGDAVGGRRDPGGGVGVGIVGFAPFAIRQTFGQRSSCRSLSATAGLNRERDAARTDPDAPSRIATQVAAVVDPRQSLAVVTSFVQSRLQRRPIAIAAKSY